MIRNMSCSDKDFYFGTVGRHVVKLEMDLIIILKKEKLFNSIHACARTHRNRVISSNVLSIDTEGKMIMMIKREIVKKKHFFYIFQSRSSISTGFYA